jgi:hypothetical protein
MFSVQQQPRITDPAAVSAGLALLRTASEEAAGLMADELARLTAPYGHIATSWQVQYRPARGPLAWAVISNHPGAAPLNFGATWPGAMPPWGPGTPLATWAAAHGIPPYLVARGLQRKGLHARHFMRTARENQRAAIRELVQRRGVRVWLGRIGRTHA